MEKIILTESTLEVIFKTNPTVVQQIINSYIKKTTESGVTYYISK